MDESEYTLVLRNRSEGPVDRVEESRVPDSLLKRGIPERIPKS